MIATITIESKKRYKRMVIAVCLAISMFVGSAFALSPSYQKVSMPDPYGVSLMSMNDDDTSRTLSTSSSIVWGPYTSSYRQTTSAFSNKSISYSTSTNIADNYTFSSSRKGNYISVPAGMTADVTANYNLSVSEYQSLVFGGGGYFYFNSYCPSSSVSNQYAYPDTVQVLVNGSPVGSTYSVNSSSGSFTISDLEVALTDNVTTIGLRFVWTSTDTNYVSSGTVTSDLWYSLYCYFRDNVSVTPVAVEAVDYTPWLDRIIAWEQSIYSAIQSLGDSLSSSLGGVGESASRIASVFARDDDIQLRDDVDEAVTEVTDSFFTPAAEGETETEFDSATKIDKQKVTDVKQVAEGATALFDTGYEFTDGFEIIATDDSFLSWFTAETATALDSTGAVATVGDDDPYNMHFYYDHLQEIELWKGD